MQQEAAGTGIVCEAASVKLHYLAEQGKAGSRVWHEAGRQGRARNVRAGQGREVGIGVHSSQGQLQKKK